MQEIATFFVDVKVKSTHLLRRARTKTFHEGHGGGRPGTILPLFSKLEEGITPLLLPRLQLVICFVCFLTGY